MKIICFLVLIFIVTDSFASSASRRRRRARRAEINRVAQLCEQEKKKYSNSVFECKENFESLLHSEYVNYLNRNQNYNDCPYGKDAEVSAKAYSDLEKNYCMKTAIEKHPEVVKNINEKREWMSGLVLFLGAVLIIVIFII